MTNFLSLDPGKSTGWCEGYYSNEEPFQLISAFVTHDGPIGFVQVWDNGVRERHYGQIVYEKFVLRANPFMASLEGVKIEGILEAYWQDVADELVVQYRQNKSLVPDAVLKRLGLWQTGKMVGHTDGRDANDAIIHALAYLIRIRHRPTLEAYFPELLQI